VDKHPRKRQELQKWVSIAKVFRDGGKPVENSSSSTQIATSSNSSAERACIPFAVAPELRCQALSLLGAKQQPLEPGRPPIVDDDPVVPPDEMFREQRLLRMSQISRETEGVVLHPEVLDGGV
jgi:hypothetical protein